MPPLSLPPAGGGMKTPPPAGEGHGVGERIAASQPLFGGDGGSRTPVQKARPQTSTGLAPRLISPVVARVAERPVGQPIVLAGRA